MAGDEGEEDELLSLRITVQNTRRKDVLLAFSDSLEEPITPTEIAEDTGMHRSNVSRNLQKLEDDDLVRQIKSEGTRYRPYLLTKKGKKLLTMLAEE
ncbi:MAG: MarR family transcriptional regulator [Halobacteriaceae archaeon]